MGYVIEGNIVYQTEDRGDVQIKSYFDTVIHTQVEYDGASIQVTVKNYLGEVEAYNGMLTIVVNGLEYTVAASNGQASLPYGGAYATVTTKLEDSRNGELTIGTPPPEIDPTEEQIATLMFELVDTQVRLDASERSNADLLILLIEKGVL